MDVEEVQILQETSSDEEVVELVELVELEQQLRCSCTASDDQPHQE